jgi:peroxiredoxin
MSPLKAGEMAPEFVLSGLDGTSFALSGLRSAPTVLVFYKNTCPTCILTLPFLQRLYERVEGSPVRFWGISQDSPEETRVFGEQHGITFPLFPDAPGYPVSNAYGITSVPTLHLVEGDGSIARTLQGFSQADLESLAAEFRSRFRIAGVTPLFTPADAVPLLRPG